MQYQDTDFSNPSKYSEALIDAIVENVKKTLSVSHEPIKILGGCGRIYVWIGYSRIRDNSKIAKKLREAGVRVVRSIESSLPMLYIGYDNARGDVAAIGEAIAKNLKLMDSRIPVGVDYQAD